MQAEDCLDTPRPRSYAIALLVCGLLWTLMGCSQTSNDVPSVTSSIAAPAPPPPAAPAGPEELALVAPLVVGGLLADFEVLEIQALQKGVLNVVCRKDRSTVRLWIALAADKGPEPPAEAGKYAVFYSVRSGDPADAEKLSKALADIVKKHSDVPVPNGMTAFVPAHIPM